MKPQIRISLAVEDHDRPQPGDVEIGQNIICPDGPRMVWSDISKADWPLLAGTRRAELLRTGRVTARPIRAEELEHYAYLWFVNAIVGLEDDLCFSVKNIRI